MDNTLDGLEAKRAADGEMASIGDGRRYRSEVEAIELPTDEAVIKANPDIFTRQCEGSVVITMRDRPMASMETKTH